MARKVAQKEKGMNPAFKKAWVKALRSGKYKQARNRLRNADKFCCLGVACDVARKQRIGTWRRNEYGSWCFEVFKKNTPKDTPFMNDRAASNTLPPVLARLIGLDSASPDVKLRGRREVLAALNDAGRSFKQIANLIEKHL